MFIEQIMIFALGFLVAGLFTLLFLPAFWRRAALLSRRQLEMQMPLSMSEIVAERDQLRAEFAAEQRRLEQRLEAAETARAAGKAELGQRLIRAVALEDDLKALRTESDGTARTLDIATRSIAAAEAELSTTVKYLYDTENSLEQSTASLASLKQAHAALNGVSDEQRTMIAGLETRLSASEAEAEALERDLSALRIETEDARSALELVNRERDQFRSDAHTAQSRREALQRDFEAQARRIEDLQGEIRGLEREKVRLAAETTESARLIEDERGRIRELNTRIAAHNTALRALEEKAAQDVDLGRAGTAAVEGALEAQRRDHQQARAEIAALREEIRHLKSAAATSAENEMNLRALSPAAAAAIAAIGTDGKSEFPALRKAIAGLGAEIARISMQRDTANDPAHHPVESQPPARTTAAE